MPMALAPENRDIALIAEYTVVLQSVDSDSIGLSTRTFRHPRGSLRHLNTPEIKDMLATTLSWPAISGQRSSRGHRSVGDAQEKPLPQKVRTDGDVSQGSRKSSMCQGSDDGTA